MKNVSNIDKVESIKSLQSTISKLENALSQMTQKGSNTFSEKRLKAAIIGLRKCLEARNSSLYSGRFSRSS